MASAEPGAAFSAFRTSSSRRFSWKRDSALFLGSRPGAPSAGAVSDAGPRPGEGGPPTAGSASGRYPPGAGADGAAVAPPVAGTAVGASESIFAPLSDALGLNLITPPSFLKDISEGTDPSPADKATIDQQIATKAIKVYVFNSQNSTPDVQAQVDAARKQDIPVATVTETLAPANATFQDWQSTQLSGLQDALHTATGK